MQKNIAHTCTCPSSSKVHVRVHVPDKTHTCQSVGGKIEFLEVAERTDEIDICQTMFLPITKK